jgi:hypothetical protein
MARSLVLDRSYLQASTAVAIESLCDTYRVIMPEALFFEMITAKDGVTPALFRKFPDRDNPVAVVTHVGTLMKHEIDTKEPTSPAEKLAMRERFKFNAKLRTGKFVLTPQQEGGVRDWEEFQREAAEGFLARYACAHHWFPGIGDHIPGRPDSAIADAKTCVANNPLVVGGIYEQIRKNSYPPTAMIGPGWALFRWLQVQLIYALEYVRRHGPGKADLVSKELANDVTDAQYVITALLADGLASDDRTVKRTYQLLNPIGELHTNW